MYTLKDFQTKKIAVSFTGNEQGTKDKRTFLEACEAAGLKWSSGQDATDDPMTFECVDYFPYMALMHGSKAYYESIGYAIVPFADFDLSMNKDETHVKDELIIIKRRPNDRIVIRHMLDGETVGRAEVRRYAHDKDDFILGATRALEKLCDVEIEQKRKAFVKKHPVGFYQPGDKVLVRDDLVDGKVYGGCFFVRPMAEWKGKAATIRPLLQSGRVVNRRYRLEGGFWSWSPEMFVGKIVPCGNLKAGDEVLVKEKSDMPVGKSSIYDDVCGKVITVDRVDAHGDVFAEPYYFPPSKRFVGKLIRPRS